MKVKGYEYILLTIVFILLFILGGFSIIGASYIASYYNLSFNLPMLILLIWIGVLIINSSFIKLEPKKQENLCKHPKIKRGKKERPFLIRNYAGEEK